MELVFFFNDTATTEIYTLSLHDALPISVSSIQNLLRAVEDCGVRVSRVVLEPLASAEACLLDSDRDSGVVLIDVGGGTTDVADRKSTRLNSSHANISYAVFCLQKNKVTV